MDTNAQIGAYLIALMITVAAALIVMIALNQPLRRFLVRASGSPERTDFLTRWFQILVLLMPAIAITLSAGVSRGDTDPSLFFRVLAHCAWAGIGLISAVVGVGIWTTGPEGKRGWALETRPDQIDDLNRLLAKVDQIRAREVLSREMQELRQPRT